MIKNIKFGIKIATQNFSFLPEIYNNDELIDFIEIILIPEFNHDDIDIIKNIRMPYAIHLPNSNYGIDFGDINNNYKNIEFIEKINQFKTKLNPICYIIHPESGNIDLSIKNIKKLKIKPIAIENMPVKSLFGGNLLGFDINSLKKYFDEIQNLEFCFDINHAIKASISKNIKYIQFINEFLNFKKPKIFHISSGCLDKEIDEHLSLEKGEYEISKIKNLLFNYPDVVYLTFETPRNYEKGIVDDLKNINYFLNS